MTDEQITRRELMQDSLAGGCLTSACTVNLTPNKAPTGLFPGSEDITHKMVSTGTGLHPQIKRSPILTTWRKLHLELDSMASGLDNPVSDKNIDDTWNNTPHTGESGAEINGWNTDRDEGQYEGGELTVSGVPPFEIIFDDKRLLFDDTVYVIGNICPYENQSASFTDDDVCPLPRKVDWSLMNSKFNPAYVQAVEEDGVYDPDATFIVNVGNSEDNANDAGLPVRNRTTSEGYWMVQVLSCHQGVRPSDFDPDVWYHWHSDSNFEWGDTDPALFGQSPTGGVGEGYNISNVFLETIRDYAAYNAWFASTHPPYSFFTASQIEQTTVVHEVGRIFGCDTLDGGIMQDGAEDPALNFTAVSLDKIRKAAHIGTP
jgi:hypothetical protein